MKNFFTIRSFFSINIHKILIVPLLILVSNVNLSAASDLEVTSNITELGTDYLVVQGYTIYVDSNTELRGHGNDPVPFTFFKLNDLVQVHADSKGDGTYLATRIKFEDGAAGENEIELTGYVTELGINSLAVNGITFVTDENTEYRGRHGNTFSFEQIRVGMLLEVKASVQTGGDLLASRIRTEDDHQQGAELELTGKIDSTSSTSIIIGQLEFFVDNQTVILNNNNLPIAFADLNQGDKVEVKAFKQSDNTYLASTIKLEDLPENEIEFTAQIENIVGSNLTVGGIIFTTDSNTVFLNNNRMPVTIADLSIGMWVEIKGVKTSESSNYASIVKIEDFIRTEMEITGTISELTDSYLIVNGITFSIDSTIEVLDHLNNPIEYSVLQVGQLVEVNGDKTSETTAAGRTIKLDEEDDIELFGKLTAINSDNVELNGLVIFVNENTAYLNHANQPIAFSDLTVDQFVEVKMIKNPDSSFTALRIKIEDGMNYLKISGITGTVDGSSIQLPTGIYTINSSTLVIDNNFNLINANQLVSSQPVIVWAVSDVSENKIAVQIQSKISVPAGVNKTPGVINDFLLEQNYPNPFNPSTTISFTIDTDQLVTLKVFNSIGEEVKTLVNRNLSKGTHKINFDGQGLSSGFYLYRLESGSQVQVKKMILMK